MKRKNSTKKTENRIGKQLRKWVLHNTGLKIISGILALIIWLAVVDYSNPEVYDSLTVDLRTLNDFSVSSQNKVYSLDNEKIEISYKVRENDRHKVNASDFRAHIDFSELADGDELKVHTEFNSELSDIISDVAWSPLSVKARTESIMQKKYAVQCLVSGDVADGYMGGDVILSPEYVYVKGPVSYMGQISSTGINIDLNDARNDVTGTSPIVFFDANGNELPEIGASLSYAGDIGYTVPVYRIKSLSISAFAGGTPATGYKVETVETSPTFLSVYGEEEQLDKNSAILIPGTEINVNGISENLTMNMDISRFIPEGLRLVQPNPEITVYVKVRNVFEKNEGAPEQQEPVTIPVYIMPETTQQTTPETMPPEVITAEAPPSSSETSSEETTPWYDDTDDNQSEYETTAPETESETVPESTPQETSAEETTPEETTPEETSPQTTAPEETSPEATTPEETSAEATTPETSAPETTQSPGSSGATEAPEPSSAQEPVPESPENTSEAS